MRPPPKLKLLVDLLPVACVGRCIARLGPGFCVSASVGPAEMRNQRLGGMRQVHIMRRALREVMGEDFDS